MLVLLFLRPSTDQTNSLLLLIEYTRKEKNTLTSSNPLNWNGYLHETGVCPGVF